MRYRIKNWDKYQQYKDRTPPWIKLHYDLLTSRDWVLATDTERVLIISCMLIASRNGGDVPNDPEYLKRVAYLNKEPNLDGLVRLGFLEMIAEDGDDSGMLADDTECLQVIQNDTKIRERIEKDKIRLDKEYIQSCKHPLATDIRNRLNDVNIKTAKFSDEQILKLITEYGTDFTIRAIEKLMNYVTYKKKRYADYYLALRNWVTKSLCEDDHYLPNPNNELHRLRDNVLMPANELQEIKEHFHPISQTELDQYIDRLSASKKKHRNTSITSDANELGDIIARAKEKR